jgi:hypothetical protein
MLDRLDRSRPARDTDMIMRATAVQALAALAVIHVLDLPGTLAPEPLVGIGYFAIIAAAVMAGGAMIARSHWLAWAAAGGLGVAAMAGYLLTRALPGGFLDDHGDVGNWRCPLGIAALSVEVLIILLAAAWAWHARTRTISWAEKTTSAGSRAPEYSRHR